MPTPLLDWLYGAGSNPLSLTTAPQGALILFPRMLDRWNVASLIVSRWEGYKVVMVTDHPNEFMHGTMDASGARWTDLELIPFPLLKYSDLDEINRALQNTEVDIIIFDDARMLATINSALTVISVQPKVIVLTTWGDTMQQLNTVTSKFPDLRLLTLEVISDTANLDWKITRSPMSERQLRYYDLVRSRELKEAADHAISYPLTRMTSLYTYPDNIMMDTLTHKYICETDQSTIPDTLTQNSWISPSSLNTINENGPKLLSILDGVVSNWPAKQLIITRFNHRYGVDMITSFLRLMIAAQRNPYEWNEIFHISCTDSYETTLNTLHRFNDANAGVLITNLVPLIPLQNVSVIHIADTYAFLTLQMIIDRTHKRYLNASGTDLVIYSHLATHPHEISADEALHATLADHIREANRIYSGLISASDHIVFDPNLGLVVR